MEAGASHEDDQESLTDLLEAVGQQISGLAAIQSRIAAAEHAPELRQAGRDGVTGVVALVALVTAFGLLNWAAVNALSDRLPTWRAPLVLAAVWLVVGAVLAAVLWRSASRSRIGGLLPRPGTSSEAKDYEAAREEALQQLRETLERLAAAVTAQIAAAAVAAPEALLDVADDVLETADDAVDAVVEQVPFGSTVGQAVDFALIPSRFGMRVVTTVIRRGSPPPRAK